MSLRKKSFLTLLVSLIISVAVLFGISSIILIQSYSRLEKSTAIQNVERVEKAISAMNGQLKATIIDWSYWDETYNFITNHNQDYIDSNLQNVTLTNLKINFIQLVDSQGQVVFTKTERSDRQGELQTIDIPAGLVQKYPSYFQPNKDDPQQAGIILQDGNPFLIVSSPIIHSDQSGPRIGTLLMGRYLDHDLLSSLAEQTNTRISIFPLPLTGAEPDILKIGDQLEEGVSYPTQAIDNNLFAGYTVLRDVNGNPAALVQVSFPRDIFNQGVKTLIALFSVLSILALIILIGFYFLLDRIFFARILNLSQDVRHINEIRQPDARIQNVDGNDEISALGRNINVLLSTLNEIQESYRTLVVNQGEGLTIVDDEEKILFANPAAETIFNVEPGSLVGRRMQEFLSQEDIEKLNYETSLRREGKKSSYELSLHRDDGNIIPVLITANPKYDSDGIFIATYGIFRDITDLKHTQQVLIESEAKFRSFIEQSHVGIVLLDEEGKVIEWNPILEEFTGLRKDAAVNHFFVDIIEKFLPRENRTAKASIQLKSVYEKLTTTKKHEPAQDPIEFQLETIHGNSVVVDLLPFPIVTRKGVMIGGVFYDMTERKRMEKAEKEQRMYIEALLDTSEVLNGTLDLDNLFDAILANSDRVIPSDTGIISVYDNGYLRIVRSRGYLERGLPDITLNPPFRIDGMVNMKWMLETGQPLSIPDISQYPDWNPHPENRWVNSYIGVPLKVRENTIGFISLFSEKKGFYSQGDADRLKPFANQAAIAFENARLYRELQQKADTDELTGLKNRRSFFEMGAREIERTIRFGHPLSALMIDLDNFKDVNDTFGHPVGDLLLKDLSEVLKNKLRNVDLVARYGGDEFIILLPENDAKMAFEVSNRLRAHLEQIVIETSQGKARVTASIGVATMDNHMTTLSALIEHADRALYNAKRFGKNRVVSNTEKSI